MAGERICLPLMEHCHDYECGEDANDDANFPDSHFFMLETDLCKGKKETKFLSQ